MLFRLFATFLCVQAAPVIDVQYDAPPPSAVAAGGAFASRVRSLAGRVARSKANVDEFALQVGGLSGDHVAAGVAPSAFLASSLIPVDAAHVRKGLGVTEPMPEATDSVNVVMRQDVRALAERVAHRDMAEQLAMLQADFERGVAELNGAK